MVAIGVPTSPMKADNSMETICENATKWLFMAWDKLCIHHEMIASSWGRCGILKMWDWQIQNETMQVNFEGSLFTNSSNFVEDTNGNIEVLTFYLNMDVLNCLCHCVFNLNITNGLFDFNGFIDMEDVSV